MWPKAKGGKPGNSTEAKPLPEAEVNVSDAPQKASAEQSSEDLPKLGARLLRETAVLLTGATAVLYLASHLYGRAYLMRLGVGSGFQSVGLGNLAMLSPLDLAMAIGLTAATYWTIAGRGRNLWAIGAFSLATLLVAYPAIEADKHGVPAEATDWIVYGLFIGSDILWVGFLKKKFIEKVEAHRVRTLLVCACITAFIYIPAIADTRLIDMVESHERTAWIAPGTTDHRLPVYWVGDHYVYLTADAKGCWVHVLIGNTEVGDRVCTPIVAGLMGK